jgi:hypothetical protein
LDAAKMKRLIAALLVGLAVGYKYGYGDANNGRESVFNRALDRFGAAKVRAAQADRDRRMEEASRP